MTHLHFPNPQEGPSNAVDGVPTDATAAADLPRSPLISEPLLRVQDVARLLGVSPRTLRRYTAQGSLHAVRFGRQVRFRERDIAALLDGGDANGG